MAKIRSAETVRRDPRKRNAALRSSLRQKLLATYDHCAICGRPIDRTLPQYDPMAPEVDEIIPVARGGSPYDIDNLQLVHRICNERKGSRMAGDELNKNVNPIPQSRAW